MDTPPKLVLVEFYNQWARAVRARREMSTVEKMNQAEIWQTLERRCLKALAEGDQSTVDFLIETSKALADKLTGTGTVDP